MSEGGGGLTRRGLIEGMAAGGAAALMGDAAIARTPGFHVHRFGVNYVPSGSWYYCWNDWRPSAIARDFDAIAELGADHIRIMIVWPWFQPNPKLISQAHLDRLEQMIQLAAIRRLDVLVTLYTGWLSGFAFRPPYLEKEPFYSDPKWQAAQDTLLGQVAARVTRHANFMGFDVGNEINCCWRTTPPIGDPWLRRTIGRMHQLAPGRTHVNGVDHQPWFDSDTFSPATLVAEQSIVAVHSWPFWTGASKYGKPLSKPYTLLPAALAGLVRAHARDGAKPLWLQEFGACTEEMDDGEIIPWMEATIAGAIGEGVSWFTYWSSHDVKRTLDFHPFEYDLGLIDGDNRIKPRGRAFRRLADAHRGKRVAIPRRRIPQPPEGSGQETTWRWLLKYMGGVMP